MSLKTDINETMQMYADYQSGLSLAAVGEKYYFNAETIWKRFKNLGLKRRSPGGRKKVAS